MANYTTADIKALREATGAGMMDVKKALDETGGDAEKAKELLRIKGLKGVAKREGRAASNGLILTKVEGGTGVMVELNCETDFVAKSEKFLELGEKVLTAAVESKASTPEALMAASVGGRTVQEHIEDLAGVIGEKMEIRRVGRLEGQNVSAYMHKTNPDLPPQLGVLVAYTGDEKTAHDVAMHIAAFAPTFLTRDEVSEEAVANERRVAEATAREEGKPEAALPKIVEGRMNGFFKESVLLEQAFAKDNKKTVKAIADETGTTVTGFLRFKVGL